MSKLPKFNAQVSKLRPPTQIGKPSTNLRPPTQIGKPSTNLRPPTQIGKTSTHLRPPTQLRRPSTAIPQTPYLGNVTPINQQNRSQENDSYELPRPKIRHKSRMVPPKNFNLTNRSRSESPAQHITIQINSSPPKQHIPFDIAELMRLDYPMTPKKYSEMFISRSESSIDKQYNADPRLDSLRRDIEMLEMRKSFAEERLKSGDKKYLDRKLEIMDEDGILIEEPQPQDFDYYEENFELPKMQFDQFKKNTSDHYKTPSPQRTPQTVYELPKEIEKSKRKIYDTVKKHQEIYGDREQILPEKLIDDNFYDPVNDNLEEEDRKKYPKFYRKGMLEPGNYDLIEPLKGDDEYPFWEKPKYYNRHYSMIPEESNINRNPREMMDELVGKDKRMFKKSMTKTTNLLLDESNNEESDDLENIEMDFTSTSSSSSSDIEINPSFTPTDLLNEFYFQEKRKKTSQPIKTRTELMWEEGDREPSYEEDRLIKEMMMKKQLLERTPEKKPEEPKVKTTAKKKLTTTLRKKKPLVEPPVEYTNEEKREMIDTMIKNAEQNFYARFVNEQMEKLGKQKDKSQIRSIKFPPVRPITDEELNDIQFDMIAARRIREMEVQLVEEGYLENNQDKAPGRRTIQYETKTQKIERQPLSRRPEAVTPARPKLKTPKKPKTPKPLPKSAKKDEPEEIVYTNEEKRQFIENMLENAKSQFYNRFVENRKKSKGNTIMFPPVKSVTEEELDNLPFDMIAAKRIRAMEEDLIKAGYIEERQLNKKSARRVPSTISRVVVKKTVKSKIFAR